MVDIVLRAGKGSPLTNAELDANFTNLKVAVEASSGAATWAAITGKPTTLAGFGITDAQALLTSGTNIKTVNGQSVLGSGNITAVESFNGRTGTIALSVGDVTTALGYTPVNKAGDTFTGNIQVANGTDSRVNLQVSGVTEGILTASATNVRLSSANAIPITIGTNGVTRLTFTGTGFITTGASEYVGIGAQAGTNNALRIARNLENSATAYAVLNDGTFQSVVTTQGAGFRSVARTAAASFTMATLHHYQAVQATLGAGSAITTQAGFVVDASMVGATSNYGFLGSIAAATGRWNAYMDGTAQNWFAGNVGIGAGKSAPSTALDVNGTVTATQFNGSAAGLTGLTSGQVVTALGFTPGAGDVTLTGTQTLTNKRINSRVSSVASASSVTPDVASFDQYAYTALSEGLTINAPTGTPVDGSKLVFRILDNGTSRTLSWNATYTPVGVTLPAATTAGKTLYVGCIYNAVDTRWDAIAVGVQS